MIFLLTFILLRIKCMKPVVKTNPSDFQALFLYLSVRVAINVICLMRIFVWRNSFSYLNSTFAVGVNFYGEFLCQLFLELFNLLFVCFALSIRGTVTIVWFTCAHTSMPFLFTCVRARCFSHGNHECTAHVHAFQLNVINMKITANAKQSTKIWSDYWEWKNRKKSKSQMHSFKPNK